MSVPKYETIKRWAGSGDCVQWLWERSLLTEPERDRLMARVRTQERYAYDWLYKRPCPLGFTDEFECWLDRGDVICPMHSENVPADQLVPDDEQQ